MAKRRKKGRPGKAKQPEPGSAEDQHIENQKADTQSFRQEIVRHIYLSIPIICSSLYLELSALASIQGLDLQSMLSLKLDAVLEQWASTVSPKLGSLQLSRAFSLFQDAAFVCALAWSVSMIRRLLLKVGR